MEAKILIVDDIKANRELLKGVIRSGFNVHIKEAVDGQQAIEMAALEPFDIVLMDVMMPKVDGYKAASQIKQQKHNAHAAIIFITADESQKEQMGNVAEMGGIDFIIKPIDFDLLQRLLNIYLRFIQKEKAINRQLNNTINYLSEEIHKRKKAETLLVKSQESFRNIVGKSEAAILIINNNGILKFMNHSAETIFGRSADELLGKSFGHFSQYDSKAEINILKKNGTIGIGEITTTKTNWENEPAWLLLINDITEHKKLQQNLEKAKEKAQESDRLKSAFLSNMSHEIRTPMNGIIGFVDILLGDTPVTPKQHKEYLGIIRDCGEHLLNLINDIVDLSKIEAGQFFVYMQNCNINLLIKEVYALFTSDKKITDGHINFEIDLPNSIDLHIKTDSHRLKQIFINLIGNAFKFTNSGSIKVGYRLDVSGNLLFFVKDTGKGIPADYLDNIFGRFTQLDDDKKTIKKGTGLGLAITRSLLKLLSGEIWVESEVGKGTTFFFTLPNVGYNTPPAIKSDNAKSYSSPSKNGHNKNNEILIVEDDEINMKLLENIMMKISSNIKLVNNGVDAVEYCRLHTPSLILMDMKLPEMDGFTATREIRRLNKNMPIIAQTAFALEGEREKCLDAGCDDYIAKPIDKNELIAIVNSYLGH